MTEEKMLLDTIRDNPFEWGPRLVYADWLEEQDRSEEAELIRVQYKAKMLAKQQGAARTNDAAIRKLSLRAGELLYKFKFYHHVTWPVVHRPVGGEDFDNTMIP